MTENIALFKTFNEVIAIHQDSEKCPIVPFLNVKYCYIITTTQ